MSNITAIKVADIDTGDGLKPGAYEVCVFGAWEPEREGQPAGLAFRCPCGCGKEGYLPISGDTNPSWVLSGSIDVPTLRPSVLQTCGCKWHGWLTDGVWRSC